MCVCVCVCERERVLYWQPTGPNPLYHRDDLRPPASLSAATLSPPDEVLADTYFPNSHGARLIHLIITIIKWFRTSRLSKKNSFLPYVLCASVLGGFSEWTLPPREGRDPD